MCAIGSEDPLGLRERLLIMYDRPRFVRSAELLEACSRIPAESLHSYLAKHFWALHSVHHPDHPPRDRFVHDLNYHWLQYTWHADAAQLFWENFDERAGEQEAAYRVDQQAAKRAGKWKTRHFRLALPFHNLNQACQQIPAKNWSFQVSHNAAKASLVFSAWMDDVFQALDLLRQPTVAPSIPAAPPNPGQRDDLRALLSNQSLRSLLAAPVQVENVRLMMLAVLESAKKPMLRNHDVPHLRPVLALNLPSELALLHSNRALRILDLLGLGVVSLSTNTSGGKLLWFTKRPQEESSHAALARSREALQVPQNGFATWPREQLLQGKQRNQEAIVFPDITSAAVCTAITAAVEEWLQVAAGA